MKGNTGAIIVLLAASGFLYYIGGGELPKRITTSPTPANESHDHETISKEQLDAAVKSAVEKGTETPAGPKAIIDVVGESTTKTKGDLIHVHAHNAIGQSIAFSVDTTGVDLPSTPDAKTRAMMAALRSDGYDVVMPQEGKTLYEVLDKDVFLASYTGTYRVSLASASVVEGKVVIDLSTLNITVKDDAPPGPSPPDVEPDPDSDPPAGFGLPALVPSWLATVPVSARSDADDVKLAFTANADLADAGKFNNLEEMKVSLGASLGAAIIHKKEWNEFGLKFKSAMDALVASGDIKEPKDFAKALREVASAM